MKKLVAVLFLVALAPAFGQVVGPMVRAMPDGSSNQQWLPYSAGAGADAVIATEQHTTSQLGGYLPLAGGTLTGALTVPQVNTALMQSNSGNTNGVQFPNNGNVLIAPNSVGQVFVGGATNTLYGASINLVGDGASTPSKIIQAKSGSLRILADDGTTILFGLDNSGKESLLGGLNLLGDITANANVNVKGTLSSTTNTQPAGPTNSGVAIGGGPNYAIAQFFDQALGANNRTSEIIFLSGSMQFRFKNDAGSVAPTWLSATGGQASGITGIASSSGSGSWSHTGPFSATSLTGAGTGLTGTGASFTAGAATNLAGGFANQIAYQSASSTTNFTPQPLTAGTVLTWNGADFTWTTPIAPALTGTSASIGGALLAAGACSTGTVAITGATTSMAVIATPVAYPGAGVTWAAYVSSAGTVTVTVCETVLGTPAASAYNVRVIQ